MQNFKFLPLVFFTKICYSIVRRSLFSYIKILMCSEYQVWKSGTDF